MNNLVLSNNVYDTLKWVTQLALPASAALYFGLSQIWGFPYGEEVVGTLALITVFFGTLLGVSTKNYNKIRYDSVTGEPMKQ